MLLKKFDKASGKVLKQNKVLGFKGVIKALSGYTRPKESGSEWWLTTTSIWNCDELIGRRIRDWRRLLGETGHTGTRTQTMRADHDSIYTGTHSVFPAPLAEWILLRYAGPSGGHIIDPFAGGPPRGVVAALMGYSYTGYDIRQEQIDENIRTLGSMGLGGSTTYHCANGCSLEKTADESMDCSITCPPYYDLEQYSDLPDDLSNLDSYEAFDSEMLLCARHLYRVLKPGVFACIVVGDFRVGEKKEENELINFTGDTITNFRNAGFFYWQDVILSKNFASAAVRASTSWAGKKLIPRHEHLLVFRKPEAKNEKVQKVRG